MRKQNPITEYAIENLRAGKDTAEILDTFMQSDLYDGVAQRRVLGNKVAIIKQVLDIAMKPVDADTEDVKLSKEEIGPNTTLVATSSKIKTLEQLISYARIDLDKYIIKRHTINQWTTWSTRLGEKIPLENYQVKAWLEAKTAEDFTPEEMLKKLSHIISDYEPKIQAIPAPKHTGKYMLEIDPPDAHIGMMNHDNTETLEDQCNKYRRACMDMLSQASTYKLEKIVFVVGSDLFHVNADKPETKKGTPQEVNAPSWQVCEAVSCMITDLIAEMLTQANNVDVIMVAGNHDSHNVTWLGVLLQAVFAKNKRVRVDYKHEERKYLSFGCTAFTFTHKLNKNEDKLNVIMFHEMQERGILNGKIKYYEVHGGHTHTPGKKDLPSESTNQKITQRVLGALCSSGKYSVDAYGMKTVESEGFLYNKEHGIQHTFIYRE